MAVSDLALLGRAGRDAAQEAVVRAMLGLEQLRNDDRFGAWRIGIGLNVCRSLRSQERRELTSWARPAEDEHLLAAWAVSEPMPAEGVMALELASGVRAAIAELPAGQRDAVALFYLAGLTHAEIAELRRTAAPHPGQARHIVFLQAVLANGAAVDARPSDALTDPLDRLGAGRVGRDRRVKKRDLERPSSTRRR